MSSDHVIVTTTTDSEPSAREIATSVVTAGLGACAQVVPITSVYRWDGEVRTEIEWRVEIKTAADRAEALTRHIEAVHGYEVPEIVVTPIIGGNAAYLSWVTGETR